MIKVVITRGLGIKILSECDYEYSDERASVYVIGKLYGAFDGERLYDKSDVIDYITGNIASESRILAMLRNSIGKFVAILKDKNEIKIISSPSSPGYFYIYKEEDIIISDDEKYIYRFSKPDDLNDIEILHMLLSHGGLKSPFKTILNDVQRAIGGQLIVIGPTLKVDSSIYLKKESSQLPLPDSYESGNEKFVTLLESTAQQIEKATAGRKKSIMLSGGLDSAVLLRCFLKAGSDLNAVAWDKGHDLVLPMANAITELAGSDLVILEQSWPPASDNELDDVKGFYENTLARSARGGPLPFRRYLQRNGIEPPLIIHGQNMDSGYVVEGFRPPFGSGYRYSLGILKSVPKRLLFTDKFMDIIINDKELWLKILPVKKSQHFAKFSPYDYLLSMIAPAYEHVVPFWNDDFLPPKLATMAQEYMDYKERTVLTPVVGSRGEFEKHFSNNASLGYFNHLVRIVKYVRFIQGAIRVKENDLENAGCYVNMPSNEGPLLDFFLSYQLSLTDAFFPKRMLYRYFEKEYGEKHLRLINKVKPSYSQRVVNKLRRKKQVSPNSAKEETMKTLLDFYRQQTKPTDSILVSNIKNTLIRDYLIDIHKSLSNGNIGASKVPIVQIERFVNMELFLKSVFNGSNI